MSNLTEEIKNWYRNGNVLTQLILINVAVYLIFILIGIIGRFTGTNLAVIEWWFMGASSFSDFIVKPWSAFTYMFLHGSFRHILFNLLFFHMFGKIFLNYFGPKKLLSIFLMGGLAGYFLFFISYNLFPFFENQLNSPIVGASAAIMAVMAATVTYAPNYEIRLMFIPFGIKLIWIGLFFFIQDLISLQGNNNIGGSLSHIGGALFGFYTVYKLQKGKDITTWFSNLMDNLPSLFKRKSKLKVKYKKPSQDFYRKPKSDEEFNTEKISRQANIDAILDKIKRSGYESLSKKEKDYLFNEGKKL